MKPIKYHISDCTNTDYMIRSAIILLLAFSLGIKVCSEYELD